MLSENKVKKNSVDNFLRYLLHLKEFFFMQDYFGIIIYQITNINLKIIVKMIYLSYLDI